MRLARYRATLGGLHPQFAQFVTDVDTSIAQLQASSGQNLDPPTPALFSVVGVDGKVIISITNPENILPFTANQALIQSQVGTNQQGIPLFHQVQSATDINFNNNSGISDYGVSTQVSYTFQLPNQTLFWRLRSSYDGSNWNDWQIYSTAAQCGPVSVWSGLMRNSASGLVDSATTPEGTSPLTQHLTTMQIDIAASMFTAGDQAPISYNSGSVTPASYGTWLIYASDQFRQGGTVTFIATQDSSVITNSLYNIYFGKITTAGGGGGTGSGGGGGTCCKAGVTYRMHDGTDKDCALLTLGDVLMGADGGPEVVEKIDIIPARPCFHVEFDATGKLTNKQYLGDFTVYRVHLDRSQTFLAGSGGIIDGACSEHIIQYAGGGFCSVFEAVVGEPFALQNGACAAHNFNKF